ncbi:MAG TPA: hypothetical protein VJC17_00220 [Candidatus Dojkabacteria bacterium]|nr:hypothetical protein [Candidatus Dojkabacteria bacterium]
MQNFLQRIKNFTLTSGKSVLNTIKTNFQQSAYQREITILFVIAMLLFIVIIVSTVLNSRITIINLPKENTTITSGKFTLTNENGKIYVETRDIDLIDKEAIRQKLGIPIEVDFEVIIPGAASERNFDDDPTYNPPKIEVPYEDLGE